MNDIEKIINTASKEVGYVADLPSNNNKYNLEYYGYNCGYPWCVVFVWWVFKHSNLSRLFYNGGKTASCGTLYDYYKSINRLVKNGTPKKGDLIFFQFTEPHDHIGICLDYDGTNITTIEGNTCEIGDPANGGHVMIQKRLKKYIWNVARPEYNVETLIPQTTIAKPDEIWDFLLKKIGNTLGVAGLMGNIQAESAFIANNLQNSYNQKWGIDDITYTNEVDASTRSFIGGGYGICQWTSSGRKQGLYDLCKLRGASVGNLEIQLEYLWKELTTSYKGVLKVLQNATSVKEASDKVLTGFEKPKDQSEANKERRAAKGQAIYDKYVGASVWYKVKKGDTLSKIGKMFGVPWQSIAELNNITAPYTIYPEQELKIK